MNEIVDPENIRPGTVCIDCREPFDPNTAAVRVKDRWSTRGGIRAYSVLCTPCAFLRPVNHRRDSP